MSSPGDNYVAALERMEEAAAKVKPLVEYLSLLGGVLSAGGWKHAQVSGGALTFPTGPNKVPPLDLKAWPTPDRLMAAVDEWKRAKHAADVAWAALPADKRKRYQPPDGRAL